MDKDYLCRCLMISFTLSHLVNRFEMISPSQILVLELFLLPNNFNCTSSLQDTPNLNYNERHLGWEWSSLNKLCQCFSFNWQDKLNPPFVLNIYLSISSLKEGLSCLLIEAPTFDALFLLDSFVSWHLNINMISFIKKDLMQLISN